ncbi:MerR family DNA-binding transcriptional regulator [Thalassovita autumnalis]|uniref:MerR family DNA-binding transcriptional regulator n=1 Tax=Thalassovita autumnalis TaxID=2072972 RepID=UPI0035219B90
MAAPCRTLSKRATILTKDAASLLEISQRMLRHFETAGLLEVPRHTNGYRT